MQIYPNLKIWRQHSFTALCLLFGYVWKHYLVKGFALKCKLQHDRLKVQSFAAEVIEKKGNNKSIFTHHKPPSLHLPCPIKVSGGL